MSTTSAPALATYRHRWVFIALEAFIAVGAFSGVWQLWTGTFAPPVEDLEPLGLDSWRLPAVWLLLSVALPSTVALVAAVRRHPRTPDLVLLASALLLVEVTVQIPFVGPSALQAVMGGLALVLGALAWRARRERSWHRAPHARSD
jgi:hypothetical protein